MYTVDIKDRVMLNMIASSYLAEPEEGEDYFDSYVRLVNAIKKDNGILVRSVDDVYVTESVENFLAKEITELIEGSVSQYKNHIAKHETKECNVAQNIDWTKLREQKISLLTVIGILDKDSDLEKDLTGILHLIDGIQDHAVNIDLIDETIVFGVEEEE